MTVVELQAMLTEHWLTISLALCPVLVVLMALAALTCEACGAPFGIFRRRHRTIDLCLRCAVLHDIRSANDQKAAAFEAASKVSNEAKSDATSGSASKSTTEARAYATQSPVRLSGDAQHVPAPVARQAAR